MDRYATLADVARIVRETRWLIRGWLPRAYVTVLFGHPENGKTCLAIHMLRQLFLGEPWSDGETCEPITCAVWVDTEAAHSNLCEKAAAWGVPMDRVVMAAPPDDPMREFRLDNDLDFNWLASAVKDNNAELVVIDSLGNAHQQKEDEKLGRFFHKLQILARDSGAAILLLHHPRKPNPKDGEDAPLTLHDLRGTGALAASARLVWAVERPVDSPSYLRVLKSNLDEKPKTISFRVSDLGFHWTDAPKPTIEDMTALDVACDILSKALAQGPVPSDEIDFRRKQAGITDRNYWAARRKLRVKAIHEPKARGRWFLTLPASLQACNPLTAFESESKGFKEDQEVVERQRVH